MGHIKSLNSLSFCWYKMEYSMMDFKKVKCGRELNGIIWDLYGVSILPSCLVLLPRLTLLVDLKLYDAENIIQNISSKDRSRINSRFALGILYSSFTLALSMTRGMYIKQDFSNRLSYYPLYIVQVNYKQMIMITYHLKPNYYFYLLSRHESQ